MATDLEKLVVRLEAQMKSFESEMKRARGVAEKQTKAIESRFAGLNDRLTRMMGTSAAAITAGLGRIGGAVAAALSVNQIKQYADSWTEAANKIAAAGEASGNVARRQSELADLAIRSRTEFGAVVDLYSGLSRASKDLGTNQTQVMAVTEAVSKGFALSGTSASSAAGAILQLTQGLAAGTLRGDEFNSVAEGAPIILEAVAKQLGVTRGELKKMAEDGKITGKVVMEALINFLPEIERRYAATTSTISQSFTNLQTALTRYIGQADQANGSSAKIAGAINAIANNAEVAIPILISFGIALAAATGGLSLAASTVAGGAAALYLFSDALHPIAGELATLGDYAKTAFEMAQSAGSTYVNFMSEAFARAADIITETLSSTGVDASEAFSSLVAVIKEVDNAIIGMFVASAKIILASWNNLGGALAETMVDAMSSVIATIEGAINAIVGAINSVIEKANGISSVVNGPQFGTLSNVELGRITNSYRGAGEAAGKAYSDALNSFTKDYLGDFAAAVSGSAQKFRDAANLRAQDRAEQARRNNQGNYGKGTSDGSLSNPLRNPAGADGKDGKDKKDAFEKEIARIQKRTAAFEAERAVVGQSALDAAKAEASFRLLAAAKEANVEITPKLAADVDKLATAYANAKVKLEEAEEAQREFQELSRTLGATLSDAFKDAILEGEKLSAVMSKLLKSLASKGIDSIFDSLFGKGGGFLSLLGLGPARASGGPAQSGRLIPVGENGPELIRLGRNASVIPNSAIPRGGSGGGSVVVNIAPTTIHAPGGDPQMIAAMLDQRDRAMVARLPALVRNAQQRGQLGR